MNQKFTVYVILIVITTSILLIIPEVKQASAHINRVFGNYVMEVGWDDEPVYTGMENSIFVSVNKGNDNNAKPVINALKNMQVLIKNGSVSKQLDFIPSEKEDGAYESSIIPKRLGTYVLVLKGTIEDQKIDAEIPLDDVSSIDMLNFPQISSNNNDIRLNSSIIYSLAKSTTEVNEESHASLKILSNASKSFQDLKYSVDLLYMISMVTIGIGVSAILISVMALKNKN
ncbi:MAG TPA: hypothetical protein VFA69_06375 [Candidatus Nitrosotalea sp.]|nr:hypothetical protein [Candidatus Nitrosotalea sp.]